MKKVEEGVRSVDKEEMLASPAKILRKGSSLESLGSEKSSTPSPAKGKQMTLLASLQKIGSPAKVITVSSPGAQKPKSLAEVLIAKDAEDTQKATEARAVAARDEIVEGEGEEVKEIGESWKL